MWQGADEERQSGPQDVEDTRHLAGADAGHYEVQYGSKNKEEVELVPHALAVKRPAKARNFNDSLHHVNNAENLHSLKHVNSYCTLSDELSKQAEVVSNRTRFTRSRTILFTAPWLYVVTAMIITLQTTTPCIKTYIDACDPPVVEAYQTGNEP